MKQLVLSLIIILISTLSLSATENDIHHIDIRRGAAIVHDSVQPIAKLSTDESRYTITIGGNINMRAGYDFNGSISAHPDFVTALIPVPGDFTSQRLFYLDATTSRIEIRGSAKTEKFGEVELCLNSDMRGGEIGSYTPRVRLAYISVMGFVVGRNFTTFCDIGAACPNIDFQGPSVCPYIYTTQVRYTHSILKQRVDLAAAVEYLDYESSSLNDTYAHQERYIPNTIAYAQYNWGNNSHIRLTGLYKSIPLYNTLEEKNINLHGWGAQLSGSIGIGSHLKLYYSGTCGEGITDHIQDLYGSGLDATTRNSAAPKATFMYGWQAAGLVQITPRTMISAGYSAVNICGEEALFAEDDYRRGEYLFANIFYTLTPRIQLATEFLWGSRTNNNSAHNSANRVNTMIQYNF